MEKFKLIIKNGQHILLTPNGQEFPKITNTIIHQSVQASAYNGLGREAFAEVHAFCDENWDTACKLHGNKLLMPDGEILNVETLRYFGPINPSENNPVGTIGEVSFTVIVKIPYDTKHEEND